MSMLSRFKNAKLPKKTLQDHAEDALYREITEEVHAEKTLQFVRQYQKPLIAAAVAMVVVVASIQMWRHVAHNAKLRAARHYEEAIANMDAEALAKAASDHGGAISDLAMFQSAVIGRDATKMQMLADRGQTRDFRDLARIHLAGAIGDSMTADEFRKFMKPALAGPFKYTANLLVAQKYIAAGDRANAAPYLDKIISDSAAPAIIVAQAEMLK
jgi:hypothetical protein